MRLLLAKIVWQIKPGQSACGIISLSLFTPSLTLALSTLREFIITVYTLTLSKKKLLMSEC
jgi:hypothetical protein